MPPPPLRAMCAATNAWSAAYISRPPCSGAICRLNGLAFLPSGNYSPADDAAKTLRGARAAPACGNLLRFSIPAQRSACASKFELDAAIRRRRRCDADKTRACRSGRLDRGDGSECDPKANLYPDRRSQAVLARVGGAGRLHDRQRGSRAKCTECIILCVESIVDLSKCLHVRLRANSSNAG